MKCDGGAGRSGGGRGIGNRRHNNCIMTHVILTWNDTFYIAPSTLLDAPTSCSCKRLGCRKCLINLISRSLVWYTAMLRYLLVVDLFRNHSESSLSLLMLSPVELWGFYVLLNIKKLSKTRRLGNDIELTNRKLGQFQIILKTWTRCHLKKNWRFLSPIHQVNNSAPGWLHLESYIILYHIASYYIKLIQIIYIYHITCTSSRQTMVSGCPGTRFTATSWPSASRKDATTPSPGGGKEPSGLEADWHLIGKHPRLKYSEKIMRVEGFINWCSKLSIQHYQEEIATARHAACVISQNDHWWKALAIAATAQEFLELIPGDRCQWWHFTCILHQTQEVGLEGNWKLLESTVKTLGSKTASEPQSVWQSQTLILWHWKLYCKTYQNHVEIQTVVFLGTTGISQTSPKTLCFKLSITLTTSDHPILAFRTKEKPDVFCVSEKKKRLENGKMYSITMG